MDFWRAPQTIRVPQPSVDAGQLVQIK